MAFHHQTSNPLQIYAGTMSRHPFIRRWDDDWSGVTNQRERKKLQNRLNQRAREYSASTRGDLQIG